MTDLSHFNYFSISLFSGGIIALVSGFVVYYYDRTKTKNKAWLALNVSSAIWSFGYFSMISATNHTVALVSNWILHAGATMIPIFYLLFILSLTDTIERYKKYFYLLSSATLFFLIINPTTYFIKDVVQKYIFNFAPDAGFLYIIFALYFFIAVSFAQVILLRYVLTLSGDEARRIWYVFYSANAGFIGGGSVFFLTFNIIFPPYPLILFLLYPIIIGYAMVKHSLFDIRIVSTEILAISLWVILLFRTVLSDTKGDQIINGLLLFFTAILGFFLIKGIFKEVQQREKIEILAKDLSKANTRLKEIDKQKSEFVSFASHQLRGPLTAIKGYASLILEGDFGKVNDEVTDAVSKIFASSKTLASVVDDYLNISRIELGTMKYNFVPIQLNQLVESTIGELKPNFEKEGVAYSFVCDTTKTYTVSADPDKLKQVIANLIDNSIKYSPKGTVRIEVTADTEKKTVRFTVSDNGIGMSPVTLGKIFNKFTRADQANRVNIRGTGLGLYVAKDIVGSHKGKIWAESDGEDKGSRFIFELGSA